MRYVWRHGDRFDSALSRIGKRAFAKYRARALWNLENVDHPTPGEALVIARALRVEGDLSARRLAEEIERACRGID